MRHPQRLEHVLLDIDVKGLSGDPLNQQCLDIDGEAVTPLLPGLKFQRQSAETAGEFVEVIGDGQRIGSLGQGR